MFIEFKQHQETRKNLNVKKGILEKREIMKIVEKIANK